MEKVDLGFVKFEVSRQAIIVFVLAAILLFMIFGSLLYIQKDKWTTPLFIASAVVYVLIILGFALLAGYIMNCIIVGKCITLSWVFVAYYSLLTIVYVLLAIGIVSIPKKELMSVSSPLQKKFGNNKRGGASESD